MGKGKFATLGESHRRSIQTTLRFLDEALCDFEEIANGRQRRSVFFIEHNDLSNEQRRAALKTIEKMRGILRELRDGLAIEEQKYELSREVLGRASGLWVHLVETESKYLRRYGETPEGFGDYIDPRIEELIRDLNSVSAIARGQRRGKSPSP